MTLDGGWALIIAGILVLIVGGASALIWRHVDNAQNDANEARKEVIDLLKEMHRFKEESLRFETYVEKTFARVSGVERMETILSATMVRFETKLDSLIGHRVPNHG